MRRDFAPWLLLPASMLTLSGVTLLAPRQAVQAAPPASQAAAPLAVPKAAAADDEGDELLEHWGDPKYAHEERYQVRGILGGFLLLGTVGAVVRARKKRRDNVILLPTEAEPVTHYRKAA